MAANYDLPNNQSRRRFLDSRSWQIQYTKHLIDVHIIRLSNNQILWFNASADDDRRIVLPGKTLPEKTRRNLAANILDTCADDDRLPIKPAPAGISWPLFHLLSASILRIAGGLFVFNRR